MVVAVATGWWRRRWQEPASDQSGDHAGLHDVPDGAAALYICLCIQIHMGVRVLTPGDSGGISEGRGGNLRPVVSGSRLVGWASNPPDAGGADGCAAACCGRPADDRSGGCFMPPAVVTVAGPLYVACCGRTLSGSMCEAVAGGLADACAFAFARADSVSASARAASSRANPGRTSFVFFFFLLTTPVPQERGEDAST